jgi:hypothetical protein
LYHNGYCRHWQRSYGHYTQREKKYYKELKEQYCETFLATTEQMLSRINRAVPDGSTHSGLDEVQGEEPADIYCAAIAGKPGVPIDLAIYDPLQEKIVVRRIII